MTHPSIVLYQMKPYELLPTIISQFIQQKPFYYMLGCAINSLSNFTVYYWNLFKKLKLNYSTLDMMK